MLEHFNLLSDPNGSLNQCFFLKAYKKHSAQQSIGQRIIEVIVLTLCFLIRLSLPFQTFLINFSQETYSLGRFFKGHFNKVCLKKHTHGKKNPASLCTFIYVCMKGANNLGADDACMQFCYSRISLFFPHFKDIYKNILDW